MSEGTRGSAIRAAWAVLVVATSLWIGLRIGRPLHYTDGRVQVGAPELAAAGMVRWNTPEVRAELPGPVEGRVAELPDGRLVYGRRGDDGTTDLVLFDPARPGVSPEAVFACNTPHNELAPALGPGGRFYFASDRPGGVGGYDLYVASFDARGFGPATALVQCNTAQDETDPAPHGNGADFVFVRIDRRRDEGRGGQMFRCRLGDALDPVPVFGEALPARLQDHADRDPAFASGGGALWFVRKVRGEPMQLLRTSVLDATFAAPQRVGGTWGTGELRGPTPSGDGLHLSLLRPHGPAGGSDLWYCATAEEVYPWWPGQRWLEWTLFAAIGVSLLLLLLLHLGRRWSTLDLVAQCLLLSLLLHLLLFLWLWGVEIPGAPLPGEADGGLEVNVVSATTDPAETSRDGPGSAEVAAQVTFPIMERAIVAHTPGAAADRAAAAMDLAMSTGQWESDPAVRPMEAGTTVQDAAGALPRRSAAAVRTAPAAVDLPAVEGLAARTATARAAADPAAVQVVAPAATVPLAGVDRRALAAVPVRTAPESVPDPRFAEMPAAPLRDAGDSALARSPRRAAGPVPSAPVAAAPNEIAPAAAQGPAARRPEQDAPGVVDAAAPAGAVPRVMAPLAAAGPPAAPNPELPTPRRAPVSTPLREDAPVAGAAAGRRAGAAEQPAMQAGAPPSPTGPTVAPGLAAAFPTGRAPRGLEQAAPLPPDASLAPAHAAVRAPAPDRARLPVAGGRAAAVVDASLRDGGPDEAARESNPRDRPADVAAAAGSRASAPLVAAAASTATQAPPMQPAATMGASARRPDPGPASAPGTSIERSTGRIAAAWPLDRAQDAAAPRRAGSGVVVALQEGPRAGTATLGAATRPGSAPVAQPSAPSAAAPVAPGPLARQPAVAAKAPRLPGTRPEPFVSPEPPPVALTSPDGVLLRRTRTSPPALAVGAAPAAPPDGLRDDPANRGRARSARAGRQEAAWPHPAPLGAAAGSPVLERPRRAPAPGSGVGPIAAIEPPRPLLERALATTTLSPPSEPAGPATAYSNRFGPAKAKALEQFGGSAETERAVADGLRYLARVQRADGTWGDRDDFDAKYGSVYVGKTALCVLAFLGAGHTPTSRTEHSEVVARALAHLLSLQDEDTGAFGASSSYGHGITTYALAECYGITKAPALLRPLENALTWILQNQGPRRDRRNRGGFGYFSPGLQPEDDYARVSVTAWMVMALESARLSGVDLPTDVLPRAREYFELSFDRANGWFRYNHKPSRLQSAWPTLPASTPAGAFCLLLLGVAADDAKVRAAVDYTVERRPEEYRSYDDDQFVLRGQGNVYFWYYGTLCCFLAGGDAWQNWNERLRTVLPAAQSPDGSFAPIDVYAREAGDTRTDRSYTTAMCVLSLEIYYRYFTPLLLGR